MNIAIMADIHGNHIALEACIGEARKLGAEEFLFLGDYLGELAYPERAIKQLYETVRNCCTKVYEVLYEVRFQDSSRGRSGG